MNIKVSGGNSDRGIKRHLVGIAGGVYTVFFCGFQIMQESHQPTCQHHFLRSGGYTLGVKGGGIGPLRHVWVVNDGYIAAHNLLALLVF